MAGTTGLEPATSAVTGQRSNQLSYVPKVVDQQLGLMSHRMSDFATLARHRFNHSSGNLEHQTGKRNDKVESIRCGAFLLSTSSTSNQLLFCDDVRHNNTG